MYDGINNFVHIFILLPIIFTDKSSSCEILQMKYFMNFNFYVFFW